MSALRKIMENEEWITGNVSLTIGDKPLNFQMTVPAKHVKPHRMLPIFQQMTNGFVGMSVKAVEDQGREISCKMGCGACCRQPVPISELEIYHLAEVVEAMDEPRRTVIKQRFADAVAHFENLNWFEQMKNCAEMTRTETPEAVMEEVGKTVMQYFYEGVACPFLENESCSIHEARPLSCREFLVTSPAENCSKPTAETVDKIDLIVKPSEKMRFVGGTQNFAKLGFLPLIRALELAEKVPETFVEKTGERWMADFFQNLTRSEIPKKGIKNKPKTVQKSRPKKRKR